MKEEKLNTLVKNSITLALLKILEKKTIDKISIIEIVNTAGVGRVSFYRNFKSKEDILDKYLTQITDEFINNSKISFKDNHIRTYITTLFEHLEKYKNLTTSLHKSNLLHLIEKQFYRIFNIRNNDYTKYKRFFYIGGIYNIYYCWLINGYKESPSELAEELTDLLKR